VARRLKTMQLAGWGWSNPMRQILYRVISFLLYYISLAEENELCTRYTV
jgi:hypothetical protein